MKIVDSNIRLTSQHASDQRTAIEVQQTRSFHEVLQEQQTPEVGSQERLERMLYSLLEAILAAMEGRKCRDQPLDCRENASSSPPVGRERQVDWHWETSVRYSESERTDVSGQGSIKTADGRCIDFKFALAMQRQFNVEATEVEDGSYVLHDPLVLNFAGNFVELFGERISFDLDTDACNESLPGLGVGSAYLVLDCNANQRVDDGTELFGTKTGNGFADLAKYDDDGNGWIDENDQVFTKLRLWQGGSAADNLQTLSERGVGALWLGSVDSPFALKDSAHQLLGEIRASGVWLAEDGHVGSLQQVDLASS